MGAHCVMKGSERKELLKQINLVMEKKPEERLTMIEVFSPGRFAELASGFGIAGQHSFDLSDGWDCGGKSSTVDEPNRSSTWSHRISWR